MDLTPFGLFCALPHVCYLTRVLGVPGTAMSLPRSNDSSLSGPQGLLWSEEGCRGSGVCPPDCAATRSLAGGRPPPRRSPASTWRLGAAAVLGDWSVVCRHVTASGGVTDPARV